MSFLQLFFCNTPRVFYAIFIRELVFGHAAKRFKKVENATAVIWKMLLIAEKKFRKLDAPALVQVVWEGARFVDGKQVKQDDRKAAA